MEFVSICGGVFFLLSGLGFALFAITAFHLLRTTAPGNARWSQSQAHAFITATLLWVIGFATAGVTFLRYTQGTSYVLWLLIVACIGTGFAVMVAWGRRFPQPRRAGRQDSGDT